jgi:hypothetical protein
MKTTLSISLSAPKPALTEEQALVRSWRLKYTDSVPNWAFHDERNIKGFVGPYRFLSNFWPATVVFEGATYPSVEYAFHASKCSPQERAVFQDKHLSPAQARSRGSKILVSNAWLKRCIAIMEELVQDKFERNPELKARLLPTGSMYLEETNKWHDDFWGVYKGQGENHMGQILMWVRIRVAAAPAVNDLIKTAALPARRRPAKRTAPGQKKTMP